MSKDMVLHVDVLAVHRPDEPDPDGDEGIVFVHVPDDDPDGDEYQKAGDVIVLHCNRWDDVHAAVVRMTPEQAAQLHHALGEALAYCRSLRGERGEPPCR